ncbi:competence/damage-inducible protein A [Virgibacillus sp. YIM 98842]|uniref:competence/damage-inducible protein A n=1 Tax=Virgibacillus sp. YIM 98842 TaxID=2663533 RepID=UPI0013DA7B49|nr:competence/damage-inducible protein A [Virgibacillus sp. YIM 98842]
MTKQYKAEIIAVGTELLLGQIANTNAQWLSAALAKYGINVYQHIVVGDNLSRVLNAFKLAHSRSDIIIVTGGLGPTDDDMTREAFQSMTGLELVEHTPSMEKIKTFFEKQKSVMTPNNRRQARVFEGAAVLKNRVGMAPGMIMAYENKTWVFLPGVPREMKSLARNDVFPYLQKLTGQEEIIQSTVLKFIGIGESALEHDLQDLIKKQTNPTIAPLAQNDGVVVRLTANAGSIEEANNFITHTKEEILKRVGTYYYGADEQTIEQRVFAMLKNRNVTLAAAESLTGGMFTEKLVSVEGASEVCRGGIIAYDANVKENLLGVSAETINKAGTVSEICAIEMASNVYQKLDADIGISFTGVAGPVESEGKPVGLVFIAICDRKGNQVGKEFTFQGDRNSIRRRAMLKGFELLLNFLKNDGK